MRGCFDLSYLKTQILKLEKQTQKTDFWKDQKNANTVFEKLKIFKDQLKNLTYISSTLKDIESLSQADQDLAESELTTVRQKIEELENTAYYSQEYDDAGAIISLSSGTGGVDAQDWTDILLRMYLKYCQEQKYHPKIINKAIANEAGIKNATISISDLYAYGNLKSENGVHRLVRISPFSSGKSRETSFALVEVTPILPKSQQTDIRDEDIKIDTFRASGHGGQSVNTTDSAVRITHIPTNIVVNCQNERSQLQNKLTALSILKSKITQFEKVNKQAQINKIKGNTQAAWGNQIRSYVMQPYTMVKDHRTGYTTSDIGKILDGKIEDFIKAYLKYINK